MSATQSEAILQALLAGRALTPLDALNEFGCFRLGARIWDLKRRGYPIEVETVRDGKKHWARYSIAKGTQLEHPERKMQDADGREIKIGDMVTHTQMGNSLSGKHAKVLEIVGRSVILDLNTTTHHKNPSGRGKGWTVTTPPVFLASLVRVVS